MPDQHLPGTIKRRTLLRTALVAPIAGTALGDSAMSAGTPVTPVATPGPVGPVDPASPRFTVAVVPDTQYLFDEDRSVPAPLEETFAWIIREREARNIVFTAHLGDVVEHGSELEIGLADETFRLIDGQLPYSVHTGNHDIDGDTDDQRGPTPYRAAFTPERFALSPTFGGASPDGYNSFHVVTAGGREWLILALDWRLSAGGVAWAQGVIDTHQQLPVILATHELVSADDSGTAQLSEYGETLWDGLISGNDQIFLTLSGHYWPTGRAVLTNDAGNDVHLHITNYQDRYYGGAAMIRLYTFDLARNAIDVETFSPYLLGLETGRLAPLEAESAVLSGPIERFTVEVPFTERFAGFAPPVLPAARPASAVMPEGTAAYWRFDSEGIDAAAGTVANGTIARDLTGNGNDLSVERLHVSGPEALTWSDDHHTGQPAHASLRFDGGQSPDRGALLRALPEAPINSETFQNGYTIELFMKLPEGFDGDAHAFMGILSWEGRSGDAGKTNGDSPDEPTCSLNLASERFLQYVVYPTNVDANPTSWSHALPVDRWMHLAVVNDGSRTVVYVDGSRISRNPMQESRGITTMGKLFVLGGTQFAGEYGQGFYGLLGDVRIVARALTPPEFLTPFA